MRTNARAVSAFYHATPPLKGRATLKHPIRETEASSVAKGHGQKMSKLDGSFDSTTKNSTAFRPLGGAASNNLASVC